MATHAPTTIDEPVTIEPKAADRLFGIGLALAVAGLLLALIFSIFFGGLRRFFLSYLTAYMFVLTIALGALFFVLLQHATKAGWSVNVRRVPELLTRLFPLLAVMVLPILVTFAFPGEAVDDPETGEVISQPTLYPWAAHVHEDHEPEDPALPAGSEPGIEARQGIAGDVEGPIEPEGHDPGGTQHILTEQTITVERARHHLHIDELTEEKEGYLNRPFFLVRIAIYFIVWTLLAGYYWRKSTEQDATGDPSLSKDMTRWSYVSFLLYALTLTFASFDLVMSLDPHFFSTIFGGYIFAGSAVAFFAVTILIYQFLRMGGVLKQSVTIEHYHDLGKFLFAFVFFWGYIAFSQYMLIWYANIPETTYWFGVRGATSVPSNVGFGNWGGPEEAAQVGWWTIVSLVLLFGHLLIPFAALLSRHVKRNLKLLGFWAGWMLVMHYVDLYWLIMPEILDGGMTLLPLVEISCLMLMVGAATAWIAREMRVVKLRPTADPRAVESMVFHNV